MNDIDLPLTPEDVANIIALLEGSEHHSLEISTRRFVLKVSRSEGGALTQEWRHSSGTEHLITIQEQADSPASQDQELNGLLAIRAALPGTFYHTPQPGAPPFVKLGDIVNPDTIIGIIETMKVMNSTTAGVAGEIIEISTGHGTMVNQNAILMRVRPLSEVQ